MTATNPYEVGLDKNAANFAPLTPIGFLLRRYRLSPFASLCGLRGKTFTLLD